MTTLETGLYFKNKTAEDDFYLLFEREIQCRQKSTSDMYLKFTSMKNHLFKRRNVGVLRNVLFIILLMGLVVVKLNIIRTC